MGDGAEDVLDSVDALDDQDVPEALLLLPGHLLMTLTLLLSALDDGVVESPLKPVPHDDLSLSLSSLSLR